MMAQPHSALFVSRAVSLEDVRKAAEAKKLPQNLVVYLTPAQNFQGQDFVCGGCCLATPDALCAVLGRDDKPLAVSLTTGSCCLLVPGAPRSQALAETPLDFDQAGYETDGPYSCKRCRHFSAPHTCDGVQGTPRAIDADGCCDAWEKAS